MKLVFRGLGIVGVLVLVMGLGACGGQTTSPASDIAADNAKSLTELKGDFDNIEHTITYWCVGAKRLTEESEFIAARKSTHINYGYEGVAFTIKKDAKEGAHIFKSEHLFLDSSGQAFPVTAEMTHVPSAVKRRTSFVCGNAQAGDRMIANDVELPVHDKQGATEKHDIVVTLLDKKGAKAVLKVEHSRTKKPEDDDKSFGFEHGGVLH